MKKTKYNYIMLISHLQEFAIFLKCRMVEGWISLNYDYTFKIVLLGEAAVGKTSFTKRYCYNIFLANEKLTVGVDFHVKTVNVREKKIKLQIWDIGGEERFRFLLPTYVLGANAAFLLYDITRPQTLDNIPEWINIVRRKAGSIPIMLIGAKLDLADSQRRVPREYGIQISEKFNLAAFSEISSKENINVNKSFEVLTEITLEHTES